LPATDELVANNEAYVASFDKADLPPSPRRKVAVIACMDARLNVYGALGLTEGDAHVIRNAGGVVTDDAIRSLAISQRSWAPRRSSSSITPAAACSCSATTSSALPSNRTPESSRSGPPSRFPILTPTFASRSRGSKPHPSSRARTPFAVRLRGGDRTAPRGLLRPPSSGLLAPSWPSTESRPTPSLDREAATTCMPPWTTSTPARLLRARRPHAAHRRGAAAR
jgi:hypothetical protein